MDTDGEYGQAAPDDEVYPGAGRTRRQVEEARKKEEEETERKREEMRRKREAAGLRDEL